MSAAQQRAKCARSVGPWTRTGIAARSTVQKSAVAMIIIPAIFEEHEIRRIYDEKSETWFFSVVEIVQILTQQPDCKAARNYWKVLKNRLAKEGSQLVTNCNPLKLPAADGKKYLTDVANAETLLRFA
jgi:hypothetical protein